MVLTSSAFREGAVIPGKYTCDGEGVSPPLAWTQVPSGTKSFVLVMDDPDAPVGTWDHWIVYGIPDSVTSLAEAASKGTLPSGCREGVNSWERTGWGGPCPPGGTHRYEFRLYALDSALAVKDKPRKADLERAMTGHVLALARLMGRYKRSR